MHLPTGLLRRLQDREEYRFLLVGLINTVVGYLIGVLTFFLLSPKYQIWLIGTLASAVSILFSFTTQRRWVFRSRGPWVGQLGRSFLVYGAISVVGTAMLWLLLEVIHLSIWLAQAIAVISCIGVSYVGQKRFAFRV